MIQAIGLFLLSLLLFFACQPKNEAQKIIDQAIAKHGGAQLSHAQLSFDFRERHYEVKLNQGQFQYESMFEDSLGNTLHDELDNEGFSRKVNGEEINLSEEDNSRFTNSLNSVVYFALLPYYLNDQAVNKKLLGQTMIKGEPYHEIEVTFNQEGGGADHEDVYIYWVHQQNKTMDYLAYSYHTDDVGTRFREAYNVREIGGIRFADYINYEGTLENFSLEDYETLFEEGKVKEFSRIELKNIEVLTDESELAVIGQ